MEEIESLLGIKINKVIASVPANNAEFTFIKGEVKIINENNVVSSDDIVKVLQSSMKAKITPEKEMVTIIPIDFRLDDAEGMQNPLGHKASKLASRAIMVSTPKKNIISVLSVPKFSIDGRVVKHLHFCVQSEYSLKSQNILMIISQLTQLEDIVKDINLTTEEAEKMLKQLMVDIIDRYGKE